MDAFDSLLVVPKALRDARKDLLWLVFAMILVFPAALWLLARTDPAIFRHLVSIMALFLLTSLLPGLRCKLHVLYACFMAIVRFQA